MKILRIIAKVFLGIFLFVLITGFIIIPMALTWAIPDQGSKYLKHPVHIQSVEFNPFILQVILKGFEIVYLYKERILRILFNFCITAYLYV